jgi:hypothetical protein
MRTKGRAALSPEHRLEGRTHFDASDLGPEALVGVNLRIIAANASPGSHRRSSDLKMSRGRSDVNDRSPPILLKKGGLKP